jgi:hypothetical protein
MSKSNLVSAVAALDDVTKELIAARTSFADYASREYGSSERYAKALNAKFEGAWYDDEKHAGSVAEFDAMKALLPSDMKPGTKRKRCLDIRKRAKELREGKADTAKKGAKANEARSTLAWLAEDAPGWLRRIDRDETGIAKVAKIYEYMACICKELGLNPADIVKDKNAV